MGADDGAEGGARGQPAAGGVVVEGDDAAGDVVTGVLGRGSEGPDPHGAVVADVGQARSVRRPRHDAQHPVVMTFEAGPLRPRRGVPHSRCCRSRRWPGSKRLAAPRPHQRATNSLSSDAGLAAMHSTRPTPISRTVRGQQGPSESGIHVRKLRFPRLNHGSATTPLRRASGLAPSISPTSVPVCGIDGHDLNQLKRSHGDQRSRRQDFHGARRCSTCKRRLTAAMHVPSSNLGESATGLCTRI